jgi:Ca2+-binding RTX toxin-like protein
VLTVNGDASGETYTIDQSGTDVHVHTPAGVTGSVAPCTISGGNDVKCPVASITQIAVNGAGGEDTLRDNRVVPFGNVDTLHGNAAHDTLTHASGATGLTIASLVVGQALLNGDAGDDSLSFDGFPDGVHGGTENDTLAASGAGGFSSQTTGEAGDDILNGNDRRADSFSIEPGADTYHGGTYAAQPGDTDVGSPAFQVSHATDTIDYSSIATEVDVTLEGQANDGPAGENDNVGADIENVLGGTAGDKLTAGPSSVILQGNGGDDVLAAGPGDDLLFGGQGSDQLTGSDGDDMLQDDNPTPALSDADPPPGGNDKLDGGAGNDRLTVDRGSDDVIGGTGTDGVTYQRYVTQKSTDAPPAQPVDFTISLDDQANDGQTGASEGDDVHTDVENVTTGDGNDVVAGSAAVNEIATGPGNDQVDPGAGPDRVDVGRGDDTVTAADQFTDVLRCGGGNDTAVADLPGGQATRADALFDCESVSGAAFPDTTPPSVKVTIGAIKSKTFLRSRAVTVKVECGEACSVKGEAFGTGARLAKVGELSVASGSLKLGTGRRTLKLKVAKRFMKAYARKLRTRRQRRRGLGFPVALTAKDAAGNVTTKRGTVKVKG